MSNFLTSEEIRDLKWKPRKADRKTVDKIKIILMLDPGYSYEEIARVLLTDDSNILGGIMFIKVMASKRYSSCSMLGVLVDFPPIN